MIEPGLQYLGPVAAQQGNETQERQRVGPAGLHTQGVNRYAQLTDTAAHNSLIL